MKVRDWIYVEDHCRALDTVLRRGKRRSSTIWGAEREAEPGRGENIWIDWGNPIPSSDLSRTGRAMTVAMPSISPRSRESWDGSPSSPLRGDPPDRDWYQAHREWWKKIKTGEYLDYYKRMYENR